MNSGTEGREHGPSEGTVSVGLYELKKTMKILSRLNGLWAPSAS